jgi:hypothetical protein
MDDALVTVGVPGTVREVDDAMRSEPPSPSPEVLPA